MTCQLKVDIAEDPSSGAGTHQHLTATGNSSSRALNTSWLCGHLHSHSHMHMRVRTHTEVGERKKERAEREIRKQDITALGI